MQATPELHHIQRWMQTVITHPHGVRQGAQSAAAAQALGAAPVPVESIVRDSRRLPAAMRLGVYSRDYRARLLECLRDAHPGLRELLGDELFDAFALDYIEARPPRSWTLADLGASFADHLERSRPQQAGWELLIVDLARLERAFVEVYDAQGAEGQTLLTPQELAMRPTAFWLQAKLSTVPCLRLMRFSHEVGSYLCAVRSGGKPPRPPAKESFVALCRKDWAVSITELDAEQYVALRRVQGGARLGDVRHPQAMSWLSGWAQAGLFTRGLP